MRNSRQPSGPGQPTNVERDRADEREEIDEALNPRAEDRDPREGQQPTRHQPSPQARNQDLPTGQDRRKR